MADNNWIQEMVGRVVSQVLQSQIPALREELVRRVLEELQPRQDSGSSHKQLLQAISSVREAGGQKEILSALLDGASQFSSRAALFVVRGGSVVGWQGRGFANNEGIKNFDLEASEGPGALVLQRKLAVRGRAEEFDTRFISTFGAPEDDRVLLIPLLLKEKVAAVLYADAGIDEGGLLDDAALEMLVLSSGLWLEIVALRRATEPQEEEEPAPAAVGKSQSVAAEPAAEPPVAAETPALAAAPVTEPVPEAVAQQAAEPVGEAITEAAAEPAPMAMAAAAGAASLVVSAVPAVAAEDDPVHRKAKRFAKLLVDEIKLYNQAKVQEGRKNRDLYQRLKEDIEKSRTAYEKRYGSSAAGSANYFDQEIIRNLAENDRALLGAGFSR